MADTVKPFPKQRKFKVLRALRRYSRVAYECGGVYTVLEDPGDLLSRYPKDLEFCTALALEGAGVYVCNDEAERFSHHELDWLVKDGLLEELPVEDAIPAAA